MCQKILKYSSIVSTAVDRRCANFGWRQCIFVVFFLGMAQAGTAISLIAGSSDVLNFTAIRNLYKDDTSVNATLAYSSAWLKLNWLLLSAYEFALPIAILNMWCVHRCVDQHSTFASNLSSLCLINSCMVMLTIAELFIYSFTGIWLDLVYRKTSYLIEPLHSYPGLIVVAIHFATFKFIINVIVIYNLTCETYQRREVEEEYLNFRHCRLESSVLTDEDAEKRLIIRKT